MLHGLEIANFRVRSLDVDRKELTWETASGVGHYDSSADPRDFTFQLLRSESPEGPYTTNTPVFEDRYIYVDANVPAGDQYRTLWYKLRTTHKASGDVHDFGPVSHSPDADLVAGYIRRNEQVLFTQFIGRSCWLLKKRTFGPRCPSCWDSTTQKRTRSNCIDCFNTGFLRGFHDPIEVWVQVDPEGKSKKNNAQQIDQENFTSARMTFYPNVSPQDILVESENRRWRVLAVSTSQRLRAAIKQELQIRQIQNTDIEYRIPINLKRALRDIQPSPPRMFTLSSDMFSTVDERTPNIFANYDAYPSNVGKE